jgi:hypothetical protein
MNEYPTEAQLRKIRKWDTFKTGARPLVEYIKTIWWMPDWGFKLYKGRDSSFRNRRVMKLELHTGGWSGNESIMADLERNWMFMQGWVMSRRGGHYYFEFNRGFWVNKWPKKKDN